LCRQVIRSKKGMDISQSKLQNKGSVILSYYIKYMKRDIW